MAPAPPRPAEAPLTGIALRCVAVFCFAAMAVGVKLAAAHGAALVEIIFFRNLLSFPIIMAWVLAGPGIASLRTSRIRAHAQRSMLGLGSMFLNFLSIMLLPLAEQTAIGFSTPLFATALAPVLLREHVGRHRWLAVAAGFVGVIVVVQPGGHGIPAYALATGIASAAGVSLVHITLRQIGATERATTTVFWFNIVSLVATGAMMAAWGHWPQPAAWPGLLIVGAAGGTAQIVMTASLRYASVPTLAPFDYVQLVWAGLFGWIVFAMAPALPTLVGAAIIAGSGLAIGVREHRLRPAPATTPADPTP